MEDLKKQNKNLIMVAQPIIPALGRLSQEDHEFKSSLRYISKTKDKG